MIVLKLSNMHEQEEPVDLDDDEEEPPVDPGNYFYYELQFLSKSLATGLHFYFSIILISIIAKIP